MLNINSSCTCIIIRDLSPVSEVAGDTNHGYLFAMSAAEPLNRALTALRSAYPRTTALAELISGSMRLRPIMVVT